MATTAFGLITTPTLMYTAAQADSQFATAIGSFIQGGNSFGAIARLGTNDAFALEFETNNVLRGSFDTAGNFTVTAGNIAIADTFALTSSGIPLVTSDGTTAYFGSASLAASYMASGASSTNWGLVSIDSLSGSHNLKNAAGSVTYLGLTSSNATFSIAIISSTLTASRAVVSDGSKQLISSATTLAELAFVSGVTSAIQTQLNAKQASDATLTALAAYNTNGILTQTAADTFVGRTITGTANEITVTNGDGVAGNPTLSLPTALTFTGKTITGGTYTAAVSYNGLELSEDTTFFTIVGGASIPKTLIVNGNTTLNGGSIELGNGAILTLATGDNVTFGDQFTTSGAFPITLTVTASTSVTLPTSGTLYGTETGSITSAQLLASMTNETGTGALVFATSPGFTTAANPISNDGATLGTTSLKWSDLFLASGAVINFNSGDMTITHSTDTITFAGGTVALGVATATTLNGLTVTTSTGTLTITNGKTLSVSNTLTFTGTDSSSVAFGAGGTVLYSTSISDTAYAGSWDGVTTIAPSKNAVYDKIETLVTGPSSATDNVLARFDGTTGKIIQDGASAVLLDDGQLSVTCATASANTFTATATGTSAPAGKFLINPANNNAAREVLALYRSTSGTPTTAMQGILSMYIENDAAATVLGASIGWQSTVVTSGSEQTDLNFSTTGAGAYANSFRMGGLGNFKLLLVGGGLYIAEGSNGTSGVVTLVAGTLVVSTTVVTAISRIQLTHQTVAGTHGCVKVSARTAGTSFTITSYNGAGGAQVLDTSVIAWVIIEPS